MTKKTSKSSIVFKTIIFLVEFFIFAIVLVIASLMYGINLKNLSFSDVNISALYLKYDKKLFLQIQDFTYDTHILDFNLTLDSTADDFILDLENVVYKNQEIHFKGQIILNENTIEKFMGDDKYLVLENFHIVFDKDLPPLLSKRLFIDMKKDIFFSFLEPTLDDIKLDNSVISLKNLEKNGSLQIDLNTQHILDKKLLLILANYEVALPFKQLSGENDTALKIEIPFEKNAPMSIIASTSIKNSVISVGENNIKIKKTPPSDSPKAKIKIEVRIKNNTLLVEDSILKSDKIDVIFEDDITKVSARETKIKVKDTVVTMENLNLKLNNDSMDYFFDMKDTNANLISIIANTNLKKQFTQGKLNLRHIKYENKGLIENEKVFFEVFHTPLKVVVNGDFGVDINLETNTTKKIDFENFVLNYINNTVTLNSNIIEQNNTITLQNTTDLNKNISNGEIFIAHFAHEDKAKLENQTISYTLHHKPFVAKATGNLEVIFHDTAKNQDKTIQFENLIAYFENNKASLNTNIIENKNLLTLSHISDLDKNTSTGELVFNHFKYEDILTLDNQSIDYTLKHEPFFAHLEGDVTALIQGKVTNLKELDIGYIDNIIDAKVTYHEGDNIVFITNKTNLNTNKSTGTLNIKDYQIEKYLDLKNEFFSYFINFSTGLKVDIPKYKILYTKNEAKHTLKIDRLNSILDKISHIKNKQPSEGSLYFSTLNDFKNSNVIINNLNIDLNSSLFDGQQKDNDTNQSESNLPNLSLKLFNTNLTYDTIDFNSTAIFGKLQGEEMEIKYTPKNETSIIDISKKGDNFSIKSSNLSSKFIQNFTKKDIFNNGLFGIDITGDKTNLKGLFTLKETTLKDVTILNNLITFVNTTPAIINPLLALPTFFRMSETNFDTNGYYIRDGYVNFEYNYASKILNLPSYYTRSKMMDFKGRGTIDIGKETIHLPIDVIFLKDYSKFLNHIPLVGYIITGEDGNFVTNVDIRGTFEKQSFETHTVKNATEGTINVIQRTFMTPFRVLDGVKNFIDDATKNTTTNTTTNEGN